MPKSFYGNDAELTKKIFNDTVGVTNNLRSLAANIEYREDIQSQFSEKSNKNMTNSREIKVADYR